jgi:Ca-activated chloride channel homolog
VTPSRRLFLAFALGQIATFSSKLEVVRIDARVSENGRVIRGLQPADFEVRDNGVLQQVDFASFAELPLNVILALDASNSVSGDRLQHLRGAGRTLIEALKQQDRVALLTFSHAVTLRQPLTGDAARISRALEALEAGGETSLFDAAYAAMKLIRPDGESRNLVIVFSDGQDTSSWLTPRRVLDLARYTDATVFAVAVRGTRGPEFLRDLAGATGGSVIEIESTGDLAATFARILDEFRQRYVIGFSPRNVAGGGFHVLQVRVKGRPAQVEARAGYLAGP